jgi:serine O-acetyltransferase
MKSKLKHYIEQEVYNGCSYKKKFYYKYIAAPTNAVYLIRKFQFSRNKILSIFYRKRLVDKYGIFISKKTVIGIGLKLPHPQGIIFGEHTILGENCTVYQQVTFGSSKRGNIERTCQPEIKDNCIFYAGSKVIGNITVSSNTILGANSVLIKNTDKDGGIYVGTPAKKINKL